MLISGALALTGALVPVMNAAQGSRPRVEADMVRNGVPIISRDAWGCPDGERSPIWVPAIMRPFHMILHHTATDAGATNGVGTIQTVWDYHAHALGWGDIGYNYLIDPVGNIYEGRAGGDDVVGAHTEHFNYGSIGVALMGDYSASKPTSAMVLALIKLFTMLSNKYGIDPRSTFNQDGTTYATIGGHRDFNFTDCPGGNAYVLLPRIRGEVAKGVRSDAAPGEGETVFVHAVAPSIATLIVRNTGTTTWNGQFSIRLVAGELPGVPTSYRLPDAGPNGTISVPLFMPPLKIGATVNMDWQLSDMTGNLVGQPFPFKVVALAPGAPLPTPYPAPTLTYTPVPTATPSPTITATPSPVPTRTPSRALRPTATRLPRR